MNADIATPDFAKKLRALARRASSGEGKCRVCYGAGDSEYACNAARIARNEAWKRFALIFTLFLVFILMDYTSANAQTYRRWNGSVSSNYEAGVTGNWDGNEVPDTTGEAVDIDGAANNTPHIIMNTTAFTNGQLRIIAPVTTTNFYNGSAVSGAYTLNLSPSAFFGGVGIDMSQAAANFYFTTWNNDKYLVVAVISNQQWNITSTNTFGNLIFNNKDQQAGAAGWVTIDLGTNTLTCNVGAGRTLDASGGKFTNTGSIVKSGAGTLIFGQTNTYTGATIVSGGILRIVDVSALSNTAPVTVSSGAVLDLNGFSPTLKSNWVVNGSLVGSVTVPSGATLGGTGVITGNVTYASGALALFTNNAPLNIVGSLTLNSNVVHLTLSSNGLPAGIYPLVIASGGITGTFAETPVIDSGYVDGKPRIVTGSGEVDLAVTTPGMVIVIQ